MNVLYDISVLGLGHHIPQARTGVFRVVENVAAGLAASETCQLNFCGSQSLENSRQVTDYLGSNPRLEKFPFRSPGFPVELYHFFLTRLNEINARSSNRLPEKVARRVLFKSLQWVERSTPPFPVRALEGIEIFHSPYFPMPVPVLEAKQVKRFLTVYDLIPILHPKFFQNDSNHIVKSAIDAIGPEDWTLCISEATKHDLCTYRKDLDPSRVQVTPLAASELFYVCNDAAKLAASKKTYKIPEAPYILSLSTLEPRKNIAHTINCFARLVEQEKIKDVSLVLVGAKGWDFDSVFAKLSDPALRERIIITGFVADEDLAPLYSGATAFIYPSFYEGFGLPPLEAMQCGVPTITSDTSSLPEVVGGAGLMVAPTDADALCQHMLSILNSPELRAELAKRSLERAAQFSWEQTTALTLQAYKTALAA
jgi:glycosyltransferase involved in cell wall biosynthesis